jgi:hypothetical protein
MYFLIVVPVLLVTLEFGQTPAPSSNPEQASINQRDASAARMVTTPWRRTVPLSLQNHHLPDTASSLPLQGLGRTGRAGYDETEKAFPGMGELNDSRDDGLFYPSRGRRCSPGLA